MRDYRFRGRRVDNGEWVKGHYFTTPLTDENSGVAQGFGWCFLSDGTERHCISQNGVVFVVDPSTVGEFTGLCDKNGVELYEGDVVDCCRNGDEERIVRISIDDIRAIPTALFGSNLLWREVIGNIHDNPELLEEVIAKAREGKANG